MMNIIHRPVVTEKAMKQGPQRIYAFLVDIKSNKIEIKKAIEEFFEVKVDNVRTIRVKGKHKSRFTKKGLMRGKTALRKKAYITLKEGFVIDLVSGASAE